MRQSILPRFLFLVLLFSLLLLSSISLPLAAQGSGFATNTPSGSNSGESPFAVSTPNAASSAAPESALFNYSLRMWDEAALLDLIFQQVALLEADDTDSQIALNLSLYEFNLRFPNAPRNLAERQRLVTAMLAAPAGTIDMRNIIHPLIENAINQNPDSLVLETDGFQIDISPVNLDNQAGIDRIAHILYQNEAEETLYEEYVLLLADASGFNLLEASYNLYAVPYGGVQSVGMEYLGDANRDSAADLVLRVKDGQVNDLFYIIQARNNLATNIIEPTTALRVGEVISWDVDNPENLEPELLVFEYRPESAYPDWICNSQIQYRWKYERNLYRRSADLNARFTEVDSLGCDLRNATLFTLEPSAAVVQVESALLTYGFEAEGANRALLTLSMLYVLTGRLDDARNLAQSAIPVDAPDTWEARQGTALLRAAGSAGNTALDICQAMAQASDYPACEMDDVLGRYLAAIPLNTDADLLAQLESAGLPVAEAIPVSEIGRADRIVVSFLLADTNWWGFVETRDGTYRAEPANAPAGFDEAVFPAAQIQPSQAAFDALFVENNPNRALNILDNLLRENPDLPLAPSGLYMQALAYDLTGARENARRLYYEVWERYADSVWGLVASEHLELR